MIITAKFASVCPTCGQRIAIGEKVEWSKGSKAVHASHVGHGAASPVASTRSRNWDPSAFAGYGRPRGAYRKACITGGNCSSFGSGRECGGHDCDGY